MRTTIAGAVLVAVSGCAVEIPLGPSDAPRIHVSRTEEVYQALHAYDFAQTVTVAREPACYHENDPLTAALIGSHPSESNVEMVWAAESLGHLAVTNWLDREVDATDSPGWIRARRFWHGLSIGIEGYYVARNASIGLGPFSSNAKCRGPANVGIIRPRY
jgi:hypothetical protein